MQLLPRAEQEFLAVGVEIGVEVGYGMEFGLLVVNAQTSAHVDILNATDPCCLTEVRMAISKNLQQ